MHHTLAIEINNIPPNGHICLIRGHLCVQDDDGTFVQTGRIVSVNTKQYAVLPRKSKFERSLEASHFCLAIAEAEVLRGGSVTQWNPLLEEYSFGFFKAVLCKKIKHFICNGVVLECGGAIERNGVFRCYPDVFELDTIRCCVDTSVGFPTLHHASRAVMGGVTDLFFSRQIKTNDFGLQFSPGYTANHQKSISSSLTTTFTVEATPESCIFRCGKYIGPSLEGSDGYCGPGNGPACGKYGEDIICDNVSAEAAESQAAKVLLGNPPGVVLVHASGKRHLQPGSCRALLVPKAGGWDAAAEEGTGKEPKPASTEQMAVEPTTPVDDDVPAGEEAGICSATGKVTKSSEETTLDPKLLQESDVPARKEENAATRDDEPPATASPKEMVADGGPKQRINLFAKYGVRCMPKN
jgi:hypothetical protein